MSSTKKDKALQDFESQIREVSKQLGDQLKSFDSRTESKLLVLAELQDFYRRLGEVELEYARNLERLAERFQDKLQRQRSQRKDKMNTIVIFNRMLQDLKTKSKLRTFLSARLTENMANRFTTMIEDVHRVNKKCRETALTLQDEFQKQLTELSEKLRRYHIMQTESKLAESKLRSAEGAQQKLQAPRKRGSVKRAKNADKLREKCHKRYTENKVKAMRARNDYILCLEATNAFTKKYFDQDVYDILECYDHNYQQAFQRALDYHVGMEMHVSKLVQNDLSSLKDSVKSMNTENERLKLAADSPHTFHFFGKFMFISHSDDEVCQITVQERDTLDKRHSDVEERLKIAKSETEEINKSLEAAKDTLRTTYAKVEQELSAAFSTDKNVNGGNESPANKMNREEVENYYLAKFKELIMTSSVRTRYQAQHNALLKALGGEPGKRPPQLPFKPTARSHAMVMHTHKKYQLFGSKLEDYVKVTGRPVPEIVESCVTFITKFGMEHQGIFRVPGSSTEINDMKEAFENGRDPLAGLNHWKDINAVAGVLRCYFRELQDPLFPKAYYHEFIDASRVYDPDEQARALKHVVKKLPDAVVTVMRYLFKFLNSITKYREQNKMDAHNLAVVFGPTLIRVSAEDDMISSQGHFNKVLETIIKSYDVVFDDGGLDTIDNADNDYEDDEEEARQTEDEISRDELEESDSEEEVEPRDAKALYNYTARSDKELSFKKGDVIQVFKRSNNDWWDGCLDGVDGYVPCAYVQLMEEDNLDGTSVKDLSPDPHTKPQSLSLECEVSTESEAHSSPTSSRTTPVTTPTGGHGYRPASSGNDITHSQLLLRHTPKSSTPEVIPEDQHLSSFKRSSVKRTNSTKSPSNSLERSRSLGDRSSPKMVENNKTASLPRTVSGGALWQKRPPAVQTDPLSPVEARGVAEGMMSPNTEAAPQQLTRAPPLAPKPKPKPKVPKRNSNPSTELIASLQAGTAARSARHESRDESPGELDEALPPPPPCTEREVIGGELSSPPHSPAFKQDTFL